MRLMKQILVTMMLVLSITLVGCGEKFITVPVEEAITKVDGELEDNVIDDMKSFESIGFGLKDEKHIWVSSDSKEIRNQFVMYDTLIVDNPEKDSQLLMTYLDTGRGMKLVDASASFSFYGDKEVESKIDTIVDRMNEVISVVSDTTIPVNKEQLLNMIQTTISTSEDIIDENDINFLAVADVKYSSIVRPGDDGEWDKYGVSVTFKPYYTEDVLNDLIDKLDNN